MVWAEKEYAGALKVVKVEADPNKVGRGFCYLFCICWDRPCIMKLGWQRVGKCAPLQRALLAVREGLQQLAEWYHPALLAAGPD